MDIQDRTFKPVFKPAAKQNAAWAASYQASSLSWKSGY